MFGVDLHEALSDAGMAVTTVALAPGAHEPLLPLPSLGTEQLGWTTLGALRKAMRAADVVVGHGSRTLPACALAGAGLATPFVYRNIGDPLYWANTWRRRARVRSFFSRAAAVTALWPGSADALVYRLRVPRGKVHILPNAVPASRCPPVSTGGRPVARHNMGLDPHRPTLAYVGSLTPEKDVATVIRALSGLPHLQLVVVGDGPLRGHLEGEAAQVAPGRVTFAGAMHSSMPAFAAADLVVLPSRSEGMPGVLIEAGMAGLPVVATDVGGVAEVVRPGVTGELIRPGDVAGLRTAMRKALLRAGDYGEAARRHCLRHFEIRVVADGWARLLNSF